MSERSQEEDATDSTAAFNKDRSKKKVAYFYDSDVGNFHYGETHPMKPHRVRMAHHLIVSYGLHEQMEVFQPQMVTEDDLTKFHSDDYVQFLKNVTADNMHEYLRQLQRFNVGDDCPVFDGLFDFCKIYTSGSLGGAKRLNSGENDVVINWSGGLHHAKKCEASGFCYINDCVVAILELLKYHERVLYIDIDIHHGDGVEEAFYTTNRVMTLSFHKFGDYFPGTGNWSDCGSEQGENYAINFPLHNGMTDEAFIAIFRPVVNKIVEKYQPQAICLQCGADSLSGDRLGDFNLSLKGHADCVDFVLNLNVPTLVLGGGGYTMRNVARCWAYETSVVLHQEVSNNLPNNAYYEYYGPDYKLHITPSNAENLNTREYLNKVKTNVFSLLDKLEAVPGSIAPSMYARNVPDMPLAERNEDDDDMDSNTELDASIRRKVHQAEFDPTASGRNKDL